MAESKMYSVYSQKYSKPILSLFFFSFSISKVPILLIKLALTKQTQEVIKAKKHSFARFAYTSSISTVRSRKALNNEKNRYAMIEPCKLEQNKK
jgi:hypothetical protein